MEIVTDFIPEPDDIIKRITPSGQVLKYIWTLCPECSEGRWVALPTTKLPTFTGRCSKCYLKTAKLTGWSGL